MQRSPMPSTPNQRGSIIGYMMISVVLLTTIGTIFITLVQDLKISSRRQDMITAFHYAEGGIRISAMNLEEAYVNGNGATADTLVTNASGAFTPYDLSSTLTADQQAAFDEVVAEFGNNVTMLERTITAPFVDQSVHARIWLDDPDSPQKVKFVSTSTVGNVSQTVTAIGQVYFGWGGALVSDNPGDTSTAVGKSTAQAGNIVVHMDGATGTSQSVIDGAIVANGGLVSDNPSAVSYDDSLVSQHLYGTEEELPDYTTEGSPDQLFDFNRFIAVADATGNHFSNTTDFITAVNVSSSTSPLQGIIVVDVESSRSKFEETDMPGGIWVLGTLLFNFSSDWGPTDKLVNQVSLNVNWANLSGLDPNDPTTFPTGYPPEITDATKLWTNADITGSGFENFEENDDLPALMYNIGILDVHGPVNVCGVVYSPSFLEIENKNDNQIQYFKGMLIAGGGIYIQNKKMDSDTIISYDAKSVDLLATAGGKGKSVRIVFQR